MKNKIRSKKSKKIFNILLVVPRYESDKVNYNYTFPLGLGYISSAMKKAGYNVDIINLNHKKGTTKEILMEAMNKKAYAVIATGGNGLTFSMVDKIVKIAREHPTKPKVILGGSLISPQKELMFETLKPDYAVYGEGDTTIVELLDCIKNKGDFSKVDGIIFKSKEGKTVVTKPRALISNIDELPFPDLEGLGFEEYLSNQHTNMWYYQNYYDEPRTLPILASRSCPFQCTFCYHSIGTKYRERSIDNVMKEIEAMVKKFKINIICIYDDLFSYKKERILDFCNKITELSKKLPYQIKWTCQLSVNTVDDELLKTMKEAGCETISYGFESFSSRVLKSMRKPITPERIDFALKATMRSKIGVQANFIFGDPAETVETAKETLDYWKRECKGQVNLGFIQPYPGSEIYELCIRKGIIKDRIDYIKNKMTRDIVVNMTDSMTDKEVHALEKEIQKARLRYVKFVMPKSIIKKDNKYTVSIKCPFCKKITNYKNYYLHSRFLYATYGLSCRSCNMRFNVVSPILYIAKKMKILPLIDKAYHKIIKIRSNLLK